MLLDVSTTPIHKLFVEKSGQQSSSFRQPIYVISYADGDEIFFQNQNTLALSAIKHGAEFVLNYKRHHLNPEFVKKNAHILNQRRGGGYWLWKPWLIAHTLKTVPEGSVVIYADSGCVFKGPIDQLIQLVNQHEIILIKYNHDPFGAPIEKTKREVFLHFDADKPEFHNGIHVWAGFLVMRNTEKTRNFINLWLEKCENEKLLTDLPSSLPEHKEFLNHGHDESILTVIANKHRSDIHFEDSEDMKKSVIIWHHRHSKSKNRSIISYIYPQISNLERKLFINNPIMLLLRS